MEEIEEVNFGEKMRKTNIRKNKFEKIIIILQEIKKAEKVFEEIRINEKKTQEELENQWKLE